VIKIRKYYIAILGFTLGILTLLFTWNSFKIFSFIISIICVDIVLTPSSDFNYSKNKLKYNYRFSSAFLICSLLIYFLLGSNLFTLDASEPLNITLLTMRVYQIVDIITIVFFIVIPVLLLVGAIWALIKGNADKASSSFTKLFFTIGVTMISFYVMDLAGIKLGGITAWVGSFYTLIISFVISLPITIYNGIDGLLENAAWLGIESLPNLPSEYTNFELTFDAVKLQFNSLTYTKFIFTIHDGLPLISALKCGIVSVFLIRKKWEVYFEQKLRGIAKIDFVPGPKKQKLFESKNTAFNPFLLLFILFLMISGFFIFINYGNVYGSNLTQDWLYIGYFAFYMSCSISILILLNTQKNLYYKRGSLAETLKGTIYGLMGLYLTTRLFYTKPLMSIFSFAGIESSFGYLINQFVFVAPTENLIFFVFFMSVVISFIIYFTRKSKERIILENNKELLSYYDNQILKAQIKADIFQENKQIKQYAQEKVKIERYRRKKNEVKSRILSFVEITEKDIFGTYRIWFFILVVIVSGFLFSSLHYPNSAATDYTFFWLCGLGVIYFCAGLWFIYISFRYSWFAGIIVHVLYNSLSILMYITFVGV